MVFVTWERALSCPNDCGVPYTCGDGTCDVGEDALSCELDCTTTCGDGVCASSPLEQPSESETCPFDCPAAVACDYDGSCDNDVEGAYCPDCSIS